ncbi:MAG TPA: quinol dehydrogenase ferredoxin subunit NapH [Rhodocyclaceae bacterium]
MNGLHANRWLLLRRSVQAGILALFLAGPWFGLWIVKGNLNFSYTLDTLPLTDPYVLLQSLLAGHWPQARALTGVAIVVAFYLLVGGRSFCAWACPLNPVTDLAAWLRARLGIKGGAYLSRSTRFWILGVTLAVSVASGSVAWEFVNPVSMLHRGLFFGFGLAWTAVLAVFLFDLLIANRGWCGRLCPVGACYSLLGHARLLHVAAVRRDACDDCNDCFAACPEPLVIQLPLKGAAQGIGPAIASAQCTNCGRCIDVCSKDVFAFQMTHRFSSAGSST